MNPRRTAESIRRFVDTASSRWGAGALRWTAALLWLGNIRWKKPPDFGRTASGCGTLCKYVQHGIDYPVFPGSGWLFDHVISPNLTAFGWVTILSEGAVAALLASGRFRRTAGFLGIGMSVGIMAAVANAPGEWYWSYLLMIAIHIGVIATAQDNAEPPARAMAAATAVFGAAMTLVHIGEGVTGTAFTFFADPAKFPGDLVRNLFGGSVALGVLLVAIGLAAWISQRGRSAHMSTGIGVALLGAAVVMFATYKIDGTILGLGSTTSSATVLAALGLALTVRPRRMTKLVQ